MAEAAERGANAAVAKPADPEEAELARAERAAIQAEADLPPPDQDEHMLAGLKTVAAMRPPKFTVPELWWSGEREGWCTGCGAKSRWVADPSRQPGPHMRTWRCIKCFPAREGKRV